MQTVYNAEVKGASSRKSGRASHQRQDLNDPITSNHFFADTLSSGRHDIASRLCDTESVGLARQTQGSVEGADALEAPT